MTNEVRNGVSQTWRSGHGTKKKCRHLLRMNHNTFVSSHLHTEHCLGGVCSHTDLAERKVNDITEERLDRQAARQAGSICKQSQMSHTDKHAEMTFLG